MRHSPYESLGHLRLLTTCQTAAAAVGGGILEDLEHLLPCALAESRPELIGEITGIARH